MLRRQGLSARAALIGVAGQQQQHLLEQASSCQSRTALVLRLPLVLGSALGQRPLSAARQLLLLLQCGMLLRLRAAMGLLLPATSCVKGPAPSGGNGIMAQQLLVLPMRLSNRRALSSLREKGSLLHVADTE